MAADCREYPGITWALSGLTSTTGINSASCLRIRLHSWFGVRDSEVQPSFVQLLERGGNCFPKSDFAIHARYNPGRQRIELGQHFCVHELVDVAHAERLQRANRKAAK